MPASETVFAHVNIVARDWRKLADFYCAAFGCAPVPPERHLGGAWLAEATGIPGARIDGMHLRLPGGGEHGPTLEIFQYNLEAQAAAKAVNRPGLAHLAFRVEDVGASLQEVRRHGGGAIGGPVTQAIEGAGTITFVYAHDPEGNIIELQSWA